jgi:hypothetical protein
VSDGLKNKAIVWTAIWIVLVASMSAFNLLFDLPNRLSLNELGDFVAGAMSPPAIFWLVMVYLQQRKEMQEQVAQTEKIARETQKQVAVMDQQFKKQYEPLFICHEVGTGVSINDGDGEKLEAIITVENIGGIAMDLYGKLYGEQNLNSAFEFYVIEKDQDSITQRSHRRDAVFVEKGQKVQISFLFLFKNNEEKHEQNLFEVFYTDFLGREFRLEGRYRYGGNMTQEGRWYEGTTGIKKESVFALPAKLVS